MSDIPTTIRQGPNPSFEVGTSGHVDAIEGSIGYSEVSKKCTNKLRLNILNGRWTPDTEEDVRMLRAFKESNLSPEEFLKNEL